MALDCKMHWVHRILVSYGYFKEAACKKLCATSTTGLISCKLEDMLRMHTFYLGACAKIVSRLGLLADKCVLAYLGHLG